MQVRSSTIDGLTPRERQNYSLAKLITLEAERAQRRKAPTVDLKKRLAAMELGLELPADNTKPAAQITPRSLEHEVALSLERELGPAPAGAVWVPLALRSGLDTKTDAAGKVAIGKEPADIVDYLDAESVLGQLGAQSIFGLKANADFPLEESTITATWISENSGSDAPQSDPVLDLTTETPHSLIATTNYSRKLLATASSEIEGWLRRRLAKIHSAALDAAGIAGTAANAPQGVLYRDGVQVLSLGGSGAVPTAATITEMERLLGAVNVTATGLAATPGLRKLMRATVSFTGSTTALWTDSNRVLGYSAVASTALPENLLKGSPATTDLNAMLLADFSTAIRCFWGPAIALTVDPFALKKQGQLEISSYSDCSVAWTRPNAVAAVLDAKLS